MQVTYIDSIGMIQIEYKKFSLAITYIDSDEVDLSIPVLSVDEFDGTVVDEQPEEVAEERQIMPFIARVSSSAVIDIGFQEPLVTTSEEFANLDYLALRQLSRSRQVQLYDQDKVGRYNVLHSLNIEMQSTEVDDAEPVQVEWTLISFDSQNARLQMHIDDLANVVAIEAYDMIEVSFNDAKGVLRSEAGNQVNFGHKIAW